MVACHLKSYRPDLGYGKITGEAYRDVVQHLFTCFSYLGLPKVLKTDNAPLKLQRDYLLTLNDFQMVLGTDNQEKESPCEGPPPTAPELSGAPSLYPNMALYLGAPPPQKPAPVCPLVETEGEFRATQVHKPFSLLDKADQTIPLHR